MTFKEIVKKYKDGTATEIEKKMIEDEVEKFETISEYLYSDDDESDLMVLSESAVEKYESTGTFARSVRRQIRFVVIRIVVFILILVALAQICLPPIVDKFFYDPTKEIVISEINRGDQGVARQVIQQIDMDLAVYSQLRMPLEYRTNVYAESLGYGKYSLMIIQDQFYDQSDIKPSVNGEIVRNNANFTPPDYLYDSVLNGAFAYDETSDYGETFEENFYGKVTADEHYANQNKDFLNRIEKFEEDKMIKVIISFKDTLNYNKMLSVEKEYNLENAWYAVATSEKGTTDEDLGFSRVNNKVFENNGKTDYENLFSEITKEQRADEEYMTRFFLSMIEYLNDHQDFSQVFEPDNQYLSTYQNKYDYVLKNGISIYGTVAYIKKADAKKMLKDKAAYNIKFKELSWQNH